MIFIEGTWYHESVDWASEMSESETVRIDKIDTAESTVTLGPYEASATVNLRLPYDYTVGGTDAIDVRWNPNDPRPDGNRAQRRAYRFNKPQAK
jgi:hypothetical protein